MGAIKGKAGGTKKSPMDWEEKYQLDSDVRTLARANAIMKDPDHHKKVKNHAKTMMEESKRQRDEHQAVVDMAED